LKRRPVLAMLRLKRLMPRSLFWRSFLIVLIPVVVLQGAVTLVFIERHVDHLSRRLSVAVSGDVSYLLAALRDARDPGARVEVIARAYGDMEIAVEPQSDDPPPAPVADSVDGGQAARALHFALHERLRAPIEVQERLNEERYLIRIAERDGVVSLSVARKRLQNPTSYLFFVWMVGAAIMVTGIALIFLRNQIRPIVRLARAAEAFGKGRPIGWLKPVGAAEVRRATAAFLEMRERITRQITQRTEILAGVSHDLRAPLTRMRLELTLLAASNPAQEADIRALEADVIEMERMIDEYLAFARGQGGEAPVETDLAGLLDDLVSGAARRGAAIALDTERPLHVTLRPGAIRRCVTNLIDNAIRYGSAVKVAAARHDAAVEIAIEDDGPGIPAGERERVFRPFVRLDPARNPNRGGAGLGLTIARDIARGHGGDIVLGEAAGGGTRAVLRLPV
jgi:two-component system osmolarity sensor histidine kinase EnvZ